MATILAWSFMMFLACSVIFWWARSQRYGWAKGAIFSFGLVMLFSWTFGESYFSEKGSMPWFFGLDLDQGQLHAAFFFFAIIMFFLIPRVVRPVFEKLAGWYSSSKMPGHITSFALAFSFMLLYGWIGYNSGAAWTKTTSMQPGHRFVSLLAEGTSAGFRALADIFETDEKLNKVKGT
jgi:hypothetical protein